MKVINNWLRTSIALHSSTLSGGCKNQCEQMWTFFEIHLWKQSMFSARKPSVLFSPKLYRLNCALLCDSSLLIISAKDKKSEVFSHFKKVKCEFLARSHTISLNKGLLNTSSHLC